MSFKTTMMSPRNVFYLVLLFAVVMGVNGTKSSLDIRYFYDQVEATFFLHALSVAEVQSYIRNEWIDFGFMLSYSLFFFALLRKHYPDMSWLKWVAVIPGLIDVIENTEILYLLNHLDQAAVPVWLGFVTCMKWNTGIVVVVLILLRVFAKKSPTKV